MRSNYYHLKVLLTDKIIVHMPFFLEILWHKNTKNRKTASHTTMVTFLKHKIIIVINLLVTWTRLKMKEMKDMLAIELNNELPLRVQGPYTIII